MSCEEFKREADQQNLKNNKDTNDTSQNPDATQE